MLVFRGEKPPVAMVAKEWVIASNKFMPQKSKAIVSSSVSPMYTMDKIFNVVLALYRKFSRAREDISDRYKTIPAMPIDGNTESTNKMIPMPPSQCVADRQNNNPKGNASIFVRIVEPVVVYPETLSKNALETVKRNFAWESIAEKLLRVFEKLI